MRTIDWIALGLVAAMAFAGWRNGLVASALSFIGLAGGAYVGSRLAPGLLHDGSSSPWAPVASLVGALVGASIFQAGASLAAASVRGGLRLTPFRLLDSVGGVLFGAAAGLALVWVVGAAALLVPGQTEIRRQVRQSQILRTLDEAVPPQQLLHLLARIDPFPTIAGPAAPLEAPSAGIARAGAVRTAARSVVKVVGTACGVGVEGTGWFAAPERVVTAAHVVAGEDETQVRLPGESELHQATVVAFDSHNDVAVLRVQGAGRQRPLRLADPSDGTSVAILGYPLNGGLTAAPGRVGRTAGVLTSDAYGRGPVARIVTALAGSVEHGDSGGPAVDASGRVLATVFASRAGSSNGGFGLPASVVRRALRSAQGPVSTGACAG